MTNTSNPVRTSGGLNKPASRLTLADLFGTEGIPTPAEAAAAAGRMKARPSRKPTSGRSQAKDKDTINRLAAIQAAAEACATTPTWARHWHPTARVFVEEVRTCATCHAIYHSPGAEGWLLKHTNSRTGATQISALCGPIDKRLPVEQFTHHSTVAVCQRCFAKSTLQTQLCLPAPQAAKPQGETE